MKWEKRHSIIISVILGLLLFLQACATTSSPAGTSPVPAKEQYELTILHTSENHGHWEPVVVSNVSQGGIARRATLVKKLRSEAPNSLLLDSGDICLGTPYFSQYKGTEGRDFYNLLGYDVVVPGNHEFDLGPKVYAENLLSGARFSTVLANVDITGEPSLAGKIPRYIIRTVGGEKIGIIGLITDDLPVTSSPGPNIIMKNTVQTAREMVAELSKQGVNKIILLSHLGFPADVELAGKVDGIDVIIVGHTETLMGDPSKVDASLGKPVAPYPAVVNSPGGGSTLIAGAFVWGRLLGDLNLHFNSRGEITSWDGEPVFVDKNIADDPQVAQKLAELSGPLDNLKKQIIGKTAVGLDGERATVRNQESNFGNLIADAMLWYTRADKTQIAIVNGGGIRASIKAGDISFGQVMEALPFSNRLVQFDLTGADVLAALENGVSDIKDDPGTSGGRFSQVGGIKFSADLKKSVGFRVSQVQVGTAESGYKPLDINGVYRIVTNDFMFSGGDGYSMFKNGRNVRGGDVPLEMMLIDYFKAHQAVNPALEGRVNIAR